MGRYTFEIPEIHPVDNRMLLVNTCNISQSLFRANTPYECICPKDSERYEIRNLFVWAGFNVSKFPL